MKKKGENVMDKRQEAKELLKEYKQEHINKFIDEIGDEKAEELIEQIHTIDFHQITELYNNTKKTIEFKESKIEPLKYLDKALPYKAVHQSCIPSKYLILAPLQPDKDALRL